MLPSINKFSLTGLPENESYSGHGDYHTSNFSLKKLDMKFFSEKQKNSKVLDETCVKVNDDSNISQEQPQGRCQEQPKEPKYRFSKEMA